MFLFLLLFFDSHPHCHALVRILTPDATLLSNLKSQPRETAGVDLNTYSYHMAEQFPGEDKHRDGGRLAGGWKHRYCFCESEFCFLGLDSTFWRPETRRTIPVALFSYGWCLETVS